MLLRARARLAESVRIFRRVVGKRREEAATEVHARAADLARVWIRAPIRVREALAAIRIDDDVVHVIVGERVVRTRELDGEHRITEHVVPRLDAALHRGVEIRATERRVGGEVVDRCADHPLDRLHAGREPPVHREVLHAAGVRHVDRIGEEVVIERRRVDLRVARRLRVATKVHADRRCDSIVVVVDVTGNTDRLIAIRGKDLFERSAVAVLFEVLHERELGLELHGREATGEHVGERAVSVEAGGGIDEHVAAGARHLVELVRLHDRKRVDDQIGIEDVTRRAPIVGIEHVELVVLHAEPHDARAERARRWTERLQLLEVHRPEPTLLERVLAYGEVEVVGRITRATSAELAASLRELFRVDLARNGHQQVVARQHVLVGRKQRIVFSARASRKNRNGREQPTTHNDLHGSPRRTLRLTVGDS